MIRVKICCIKSVEEARIAVGAGASALGFVSEMPSVPGVVSYEKIADILRTIPPAIGTFLLTSKRSAEEILLQHRLCPTNTLQLTDTLAEEELPILRKSLPGIKLVQVVHVIDESSVREAVEVSKFVDGILLDSGNPNLEIKELGGTGKVHDWRLSRRIRDEIDIPLFLAGGLRANNVRLAISQVAPFGVDICSGVRTEDVLDSAKLNDFMAAIRVGDQTTKIGSPALAEEVSLG